MSGGYACSCEPINRSKWRVTALRHHRSAFSGGRITASDYSELRCLGCGNYWRTKAKYVDCIASAQGDEATRAV